MKPIPLTVGLPELGLVLLATIIIFAILGPRLVRDVRARLASGPVQKVRRKEQEEAS